MDRVTVYSGQLSRETDLLQSQQNIMVALAKLAAGTLGTNTVVNGFTCVPTTPTASLNVVVTMGEVYQIENLEQSTWSSLSADLTDSILKQGIMLGSQTFGITPPGTSGFSQVYLVEVQYQDLDTGSVVLPYFNSSNPSSPFSGPANSGTAQNTIRQGKVAIQLKAGTAAVTGSQVTPTADAGWVGLFAVTVANGATSVTSGNIVQLTTAPFIPVTLPGVPTGVLNGSWIYAADTGSANAYAATVFPPPASLVAGMSVRVKIANANTGASTFNLNGLGAHSIVRSNSAAVTSGDIVANQVLHLVFDGTNWQIANYIPSGTGSVTNNNTTITGLQYCVDTGTVNNIVAPFSPVISSLAAGLAIEVKIANTCTGATQITVNSLSAKNVIFPDGSAMQPGSLKAGMVAILVYDGTSFQLVSTSDAKTALRVLELNGSGQTVISQNISKVTCYAAVRNTLSTSTWDGQNLTIGTGEDGLWSFAHTASLGNVFNSSLFVWITRTRSSVTQWYQGFCAYGPTGGFTSGIMDTNGTVTQVLDLQVGDIINFYVNAFGPSGAYQLQPITANDLPVSDNINNVVAYRISGLH